MSEDTNKPEEQPETPAEELEQDDAARDEGDNTGNSEEEEDDAPATKADGTYTKAEFEKVVKRRQRALEEKRKLETELRELKKATATKEQKLQMEAEEKAQAQANRFKPALVKLHVAQEMAFLGLNKTQIEQIVKFVDMDNIDVDLEDNSVEGVDAEVVRIKETFPALFPENAPETDTKKPAPRKRVPKVDGADKPPPPKPSSAKDKLRARLYKG